MFVDYILGTADIKAKDTNLIQRLNESDIQFSRVRVSDEGILFTIPLYKLRKLESVIEENEYEVVKVSGLPRILMNYKKRWGLAVGIILCILILYLSTQVIWTFEVSGNELVKDEEIIEVLSDLGCTYGAFYNKLDFDMLCNDFLIRMPDVAWISVNMNGTHAYVEVKETVRGSDEIGGCNNVIASCDAQIVQITAYSGKKQVAIGDVVRKGDLLISAVGTFGEGRNKIESANGLVLAETTIDFEITVPREKEEKIYSDDNITLNRLKFFNFYINLFVKGGIPYEKYDKIIENNQVQIGNGLYLPIWLKTEEFKEYYTDKVRITENEARLEALAEYRSRLKEIASYCEILNMTTSHYSDEDEYVIKCSLYCIQDIAELSPITVE